MFQEASHESRNGGTWEQRGPAADSTPAATSLARLFARDGANLRLGQVLQAVEADILPRILLARADGGHAPPRSAVDSPDDAATALFVRLLLGHDADTDAPLHVAAMRAKGRSVEQICLYLFEPAARCLGTMWDDDLCSFVEVALALGTLQTLLRALSRESPPQPRWDHATRRILLLPLPGDQHTFGLSMVAEFFRRAAWSVATTPFRSRAELGEAVRQERFAVAGFSLGCAERLDELAAAVQMVRRSSCNAGIGILVGGPAFAGRPDLAIRVGADATVGDAQQALAQAERHVGQAG